jgi:Tfp pilus assembly protein PilN
MHTISPRGPGATLEDNVRRVSDELLKTVEFYNNNHPQSPLSPATSLLLTGELSANAAACQLIQAEIGHPVEPLKLPLKLPHDLPAASFATNIGLALKKLPLKSATNGDATYFCDINLNILSGQFGIKTSWFRLPNILLSLAILTGLGLLLPLSQLGSQADAEATRLQTELTGITQELNQAKVLADEAKQIEDQTKKIIADAETARQEYQYFSSISGDFALNLKLVTDVLPPGAYFTSVEMGKNQVTVKGEADNPFTVVAYVTALEALGKFSDVRITSIDDSKSTAPGAKEVASSGVSFNVAISK